GVCHVGLTISRLYHLGALGYRRLLVADDDVFGGKRQQKLVDLGWIGQPPVTLFGISKRGIDFPTILWVDGGLGATVAVASRCRSTSAASSCDTKAFGREIDENCARFRTRKPQRSAAILDRLTAGRDALVRAATCISRNDTHAGERQVELFGRDLGERRGNALSKFDLSRKDGRATIRVDADPGVEQAVLRQAAGQFRRLLRQRVRIE